MLEISAVADRTVARYILEGVVMLRKKISNLEKVKIVLSSLQDDVVITKFCVERRIPRSTFYRWRNLVLVGLSVLMSGNKTSSGRKSTSRIN